MITPFRVFEEDIFPMVHNYVVHKLEKTHTQREIAQKLGITQAMVSKYACKDNTYNGVVENIGEKIIESFDESSERRTQVLTAYCFKLLNQAKICGLCNTKNNLSNCNACMNLDNSSEKTSVLSDISKAMTLLEKDNPIDLIPNVMMNIAVKTNKAKTKSDVASIPGRIVKINGKIKASNLPSFNSSNHLAGILLRKEIYKAVINIRYDKGLEKKVYQNKLEADIDKGGFGIEPCIYLFGSSAVELVRNLRKLK